MKFNKYDRSFLSNNYFCVITVVIGDKEYQFSNVESAYQALKCIGNEELFCRTSAETAKELALYLPHRDDWNSIRLQAMYVVLKAKFTGSGSLKYLLCKTNGKLKEVNETKDTFWGTYEGKGENHLGKLLMQIRDELK